MKLTLAPLAFVFALATPGFGQVAEFWVGAGQSMMTNNNIGTTSSFGGSASDIQLADGFSHQLPHDLQPGKLFRP